MDGIKLNLKLINQNKTSRETIYENMGDNTKAAGTASRRAAPIKKTARMALLPVVKLGEECFNMITRFANVFWALWDIAVYRPKIIYEDKDTKDLMKKGGCILVANHTAHKDGSFMPHVLGSSKTHVLITRKWYDKKAIMPFFKALQYIPIDLKETDTEWEEISKEFLEDKENILIFPEGELERSGGMLPFLPGFLILARHTGAPVIPMAISGGYSFGRRVVIKVGTPPDFDPCAKGRPSVILKKGAKLYREKVLKMLRD